MVKLADGDLSQYTDTTPTSTVIDHSGREAEEEKVDEPKEDLIVTNWAHTKVILRRILGSGGLDEVIVVVVELNDAVVDVVGTVEEVMMDDI